MSAGPSVPQQNTGGAGLFSNRHRHPNDPFSDDHTTSNNAPTNKKLRFRINRANNDAVEKPRREQAHIVRDRHGYPISGGRKFWMYFLAFFLPPVPLYLELGADEAVAICFLLSLASFGIFGMLYSLWKLMQFYDGDYIKKPLRGTSAAGQRANGEGATVDDY